MVCESPNKLTILKENGSETFWLEPVFDCLLSKGTVSAEKAMKKVESLWTATGHLASSPTTALKQVMQALAIENAAKLHVGGLVLIY